MKLKPAQTTCVKGMKKTTSKKMGEMQPKRLVKAIHLWILSKNEKAKMVVFEIVTDKDAQDFVLAVAEELELSAAETPEFKAALSGIKADDPYKKVKGKYGVVPAEQVEEVCTRFKIKREVIVDAINTLAGPKGQNGVKEIQGGLADKYPAELKLMAMGGERLYSSKPGPKYVFDEIGKHS
jgi:hypothetical protein